MDSSGYLERSAQAALLASWCVPLCGILSNTCCACSKQLCSSACNLLPSCFVWILLWTTGLPHCPASMTDAVASLSMVVPCPTLYFCGIPDFVKLLMFSSNLFGALQLISTLSFHQLLQRPHGFVNMSVYDIYLQKEQRLNLNLLSYYLTCLWCDRLKRVIVSFFSLISEIVLL